MSTITDLKTELSFVQQGVKEAVAKLSDLKDKERSLLIQIYIAETLSPIFVGLHKNDGTVGTRTKDYFFESNKLTKL